MSENEYIVNIRNAVSESDQNNLFEKGESSQLVKACIEYLKFSGYKVVQLPKYIYTIKSLDDLISFFYSMLELKHPGHVSDYRNIAENRAIAKRFVEARRKSSGISRKEALNECAEIIRTVFNHEHEFNFKYKMTLRLFGQDKFGWVTDKAIQIINKNLEVGYEELAESMRDEMIDAQDKKDLGFGDLQEILDELERANVRKKEKSYGKKEK